MALKFSTYWKSLGPEAKQRLAERAFTSMGYLHHLSNGVRIPSERMKWVIREITGCEMEFTKKKK